MTDGLLEDIIQLEKKIQAEVTGERVRAGEWQQRELVALENSFAEAQTAEKKHSQETLAKKKAALQREGATLEAASSAWCERLSNLDETILRDILKRHLAVVLPGGDHDHPHGQS